MEPHNTVYHLLSSPLLKQAPLFRGRKLFTVCSPPPSLFLNISRLYQLWQYHCSVTLIHYGLFTCWKFSFFVFDHWFHDVKLHFPALFYFSYQFFYYGELSIIFAKSNTFLPSESCPLCSHLLELKYQAPPWELHREFLGSIFWWLILVFYFPKVVSRSAKYLLSRKQAQASTKQPEC